eukprot:5682659-Pyramimonas_sp.AAC.2
MFCGAKRPKPKARDAGEVRICDACKQEECNKFKTRRDTWRLTGIMGGPRPAPWRTRARFAWASTGRVQSIALDEKNICPGSISRCAAASN